MYFSMFFLFLGLFIPFNPKLDVPTGEKLKMSNRQNLQMIDAVQDT